MALFKCVTKWYCLQYSYLGREKQHTEGNVVCWDMSDMLD
jgi:hypothetical protein